jgi:peptidoglycan hydrolase CwlO-like protein
MDKEKTTRLLTLLIIIMVIAIGVVGYLLIEMNQDYDKLEKELSQTVSAKDFIEEDLEELYTDYDSIQTDNDSMAAKLDKEQEKIAVLLDELKTVKANNAAVIKKYKEETETLRNIMKSYVYQIDSLNQLNNQLMAENNEVRENNQRLQYEMDEVVNKNDQLELTVQKAAMVKATNIVSQPYKKDNFFSSDRETNKAGKVDKIETSFTLIENSVAEPGERTVYLRIVRPDGYVLVNNDDNIFTYEEESLAYSASRVIQYDGQFLDVVIYYDVQQSLLAGKYPVELYMDGYLIGSTDFILE